MGLDCTHGAFNGAYSSFNQFRKALAAACGGSWPPHDPDWRDPDDPGADVDPRAWYWREEVVPADLIDGMNAIMDHSDCDGELTTGECVEVAKFMRWAAPRMLDPALGHLSRAGLTIGDVALRFADGCDLAVKSNEPLGFH
jgi:hypothetical protein